MSRSNAKTALDAYDKLVDRLQKQIDKLEAEVAHLKTDNEFLRSEVSRLNAAKRTIITNPNPNPYPWAEGPYVFPPDKDSVRPSTKPWRTAELPDSINPHSLPDSINPHSLPDDFSIRPRPWYDNPNYRLNSPDGPYVGAGKVTCAAGVGNA